MSKGFLGAIPKPEERLAWVTVTVAVNTVSPRSGCQQAKESFSTKGRVTLRHKDMGTNFSCILKSALAKDRLNRRIQWLRVPKNQCRGPDASCRPDLSITPGCWSGRLRLGLSQYFTVFRWEGGWSLYPQVLRAISNQICYVTQRTGGKNQPEKHYSVK